jgi:hypothetical protein
VNGLNKGDDVEVTLRGKLVKIEHWQILDDSGYRATIDIKDDSGTDGYRIVLYDTSRIKKILPAEPKGEDVIVVADYGHLTAAWQGGNDAWLMAGEECPYRWEDVVKDAKSIRVVHEGRT